jgi:hypothetical protein
MKPKTKAIIFILTSFLLGILCGWYLQNRIIDRIPHRPMRGHGDFVKVLTDRLHLDKQQIAQIDSILDSNKKKMEIFKVQALAMRDTTRMEIRKVLNTEQTKNFDEFNIEKDKQEAKWREEEPQKK